MLTLLALLAAARTPAAAADGRVAQSPAPMQHGIPHQHGAGGETRSGGACEGLELTCATTVTPAFGPDGSLWLAWQAGGRVSVAMSSDHGATFSTPVLLPQTSEPLDNGPDARPKIAIGGDGRVVVAYAMRDDKFRGQVFVATSLDRGKSFGAPAPLAPRSPSQRFETIAFDPDGRLFAAWIDKRNAVAAKTAGTAYAGAALAYTWADASSGMLQAGGAIARDNTCECCRIAVGFVGPGRPVVLFRNIFEGSVRDHGVITFQAPDAPGPIRRVSIDDAVTEACPHHGPSLAIGSDGTYHVVWMAVGRALKGAFYARSTDGGATFSAPQPLGSHGAQASRPFVLQGPDGLHVIWKEFDGESTAVRLMTSLDGGKSFGALRTLAQTTDGSDHPLLISDGTQSYLSWMTQRDGYRLIPIGGAG